MKTSFHILVCLIINTLFIACDHTPDYILKEKQMEDLLVDIHKSEALIETEYEKFNTSEKKEALRESVFRKHNTNKAQFDTSLMWYGRNLEKYVDIYGKVIERLRTQEKQVSGLITDNNSQPLSRPGDSINIWRRDNFFIFEPHAGRQVFTFEINSDENTREQDIFVLKLKFGMLPKQHIDYPKVILALKQQNDSIRFTSTDIRHDGPVSLMITSDKGTKASRIFGSVIVPSEPSWATMYIDSISLMRIRYKEGIIPKTSEKIPPSLHNVEKKDSIKNK